MGVASAAREFAGRVTLVAHCPQRKTAHVLKNCQNCGAVNSANARSCYVCVSPLAIAQAEPAPATGRRYASFPDEVVAAPDTEMDTSAAIARDLLKSLQKKSAAKRPRMPKAVETPIAPASLEEMSAAPVATIEEDAPAAEAAANLAAASPATVDPALHSAPQAAQAHAPLLHAEPLEKPSASAQAFAEEAKLASDTIYGGAKSRPVRKAAKPEPVATAAVQDSRATSDTIYGGAKAPSVASLMSAGATAPVAAEPAPSESDTIYGAVKSPLREPPVKWEARIDWAAADQTPPPNTHEPVFTEEVAMPTVVEATSAAESAAQPRAAAEPVVAREEETTTPTASMTSDTLEAEMAAAFAKVRSAASDLMEKVTHAEPEQQQQPEAQAEAVSEPEPELVAVGAPAEQSADASATMFGARSSAPAAPVFAPVAADGVAEPPAPRAPSSTTWGRVQPSATASEDWRRELSNRVEAYRARTGPAEEAPQDALPFIAEEDTAAQIEADLAAAEAAAQEPAPEAPSPRASLRTAARRRPDTMEILALQPEFDFAAAETEDRPHAPLVPVAELGERRAAGLLDAAFIVASYLAFLVCFTSLGQGKITTGKGELAILGVAFFLFYVQYFGLFTIFGGITPGMMIRGLRPVSFDGASPSAQQLLQRTFGYVVSAGSLLLGFLWSLWDEDHLTWHDRMSHTYLTHAAPQTANDER